jgi:hypothetical protein
MLHNGKPIMRQEDERYIPKALVPEDYNIVTKGARHALIEKMQKWSRENPKLGSPRRTGRINRKGNQ